ncbi:flagellar export protein FliJ [Oceanobacillus chungangensis]|uniref:Flagellar FliJ protein n=1 Tax=Oceanobacillus chungangensis TaxID=1229152 RepID=A0A3D8PPG9_9BACI|nr:flagellar export protein FliJ [Oceanobacillus chungangensis]RDW17834.1 flagellar export protein FliJ [Oceanobacillus chungangensis]
MAETVVFSKILHVRENEKKAAQKIYYQAMDVFERAASELYILLKKKEAAEETYDRYIQTTTALNKIIDQVNYIEQLNNQIILVEKNVQKARTDMEAKQLKLTDAHVEVKKFEKIIELRKETEANKVKQLEKSFMDEISMNQYLSHKNG